MIEKTLPTLLTERAKNEANAVALRQKYLGIWNEVSWGDYKNNVEYLAMALSEQYGFKSGERLAIIGENRPQWLYAQLAAQSLGGVSVGIYQESLPDQIEFYLNDCKARIVIVEDQEQVDKLLQVEDNLPLVEHIIYYNNQGMRHYKNDKLGNLDDLLSTGETLAKDNPSFFIEKVSKINGNSPAIIAYSAATSGRPKGAILTHFNLLEAAKNLAKVDEMKKNDDYFSFLPLSWVHEQVVSIVLPLVTGVVVNFPEKSHTVMGDLREIGPQTLLAPPRVYQSLMSNFNIRIEGASWFKRKVYQVFRKYGDKKALATIEGKALSSMDKFMYWLGDAFIFSAIRDHLGFTRIKRAYVAGAALQSDAFYFYHGLGVNLKQTYGGTEVAGIAFVQHDNDIKPGSSGVPIPDTEVKVEADGTIYLKNNAIFSEYLNEADRKLVVDGWISLGDNGYLDEDGHLHILDRQEDVITNESGESIYPRLIENKLKSCVYIQEAVCFGKNRPYMTAIVNIDLSNVGRWADKNRIVYTEYSDLSRSPKVAELIEQEVTKLMEQLPPHMRVKKFSILHKQFTADQGELTRTLKIRRKFVEEKYHKLMDAMYSDSEEVLLSSSEVESMSDVSLTVIELNIKQEVA
ncbi:long-chain fatty acid--CoA ligase [Lysinibacillus contaminans]|uniref:Acyl-CoA synthetase n=1 Tax=Lysinibacillus contaminans TaxID=1293441 RepID=A0ABR5JX96_9BACI|nr:AMP-binding protein [Lysinibacillus contaminans]KOS66857.1 long-chain fatty acid--CoA ligase [Lysinibacillus contaminans]